MATEIVYATDTKAAVKKLENAIARLGATDLDHGFASSRNDSSAWISFMYKGKKYRFDYSKSRAAYFGISIPQQKDVLVLLVNGIVDLARLASRGVFDFGQLIEGFKSLEFIEVPSWAQFMGFNSRPRNMMEVEQKFKELSKAAMNPNTNPDDFMKLQEARKLAQQYFGVRL